MKQWNVDQADYDTEGDSPGSVMQSWNLMKGQQRDDVSVIYDDRHSIYGRFKSI